MDNLFLEPLFPPMFHSIFFLLVAATIKAMSDAKVETCFVSQMLDFFFINQQTECKWAVIGHEKIDKYKG